MKRGTFWRTIALLLAPICVLAEGPRPPPLTESEVQSLARLDQLSGWVGARVELSRGLCVLQGYTGRLPENSMDQIAERDENRLRQSWEYCLAGEHEHLRLAAELHASMQRTFNRLRGPYRKLEQCPKAKGTEMLESCLVAAVGRPLTGKERTTWGTATSPTP